MVESFFNIYYTITLLQFSIFNHFNELQVDAKKADESENDKNSETNVVRNDATDEKKGKFK